MAYSKEVREFVAKRVEELPGTWEEKRLSLVAEVKEKFGEILTVETGEGLRKNVEYWTRKLDDKIDSAMKMLDEAVEERKAYEVEGESVVFHVKKKTPEGDEYVAKYAIPFPELEAIWYDYSRHGKNLSGKNVLIEHGLKRETLALLRSRLGLAKDDNAVPQVVLDYLYETYGEESAEAKIVEVTHKSYEDRHRRKFQQADKRVVDRLVRLGSDFKAQVDFYREAVKDYEPRDFGYVPTVKESSGTLNVFFSDFHYGNGNETDTDRMMKTLFDWIVAQPETTVNLNSIGDLVENLAPNGMHEGQVKHMSMHGRKLMMYVVNVFEEFIAGLRKAGKKVKFRGKGGNHDRVSEKHGDDEEKTGAWMIYELVKRGLSNLDVEIDYYMEDVTKFSEGNLHFILHHGDEGFANRKPEDVLWKNGDQSKYNVIIHGDRHNLTIKETKDAMMIGLPALAGKGRYDTKLDLHSEPGAVIVTENGHGTADVFVKRLK